MIGRVRHLARRFVEWLRAHPLTAQEQAEVAELLRPEETDLFWRQPVADQRHGWNGVMAVRTTVGPGNRTLERAALLHDVGKASVGLGVIGRALASGLELLHLPMTRRMHLYLAHGDTGAALLAAAGAEREVVAFTAHHHGDRPSEISPENWEILLAADAETKHRPWPSRPLR